MEHGFFRSLVDISFTSFVTTKIIKFIYVVTLMLIAIAAVVLVVAMFREDIAWGVLALLAIAPLGVLVSVVLVRLWFELVIQAFRITELLRDQNQMQRAAFANAGWLPSGGPTAQSASAGSACPACGAIPSPGAAFCRNCGQRLA